MQTVIATALKSPARSLTPFLWVWLFAYCSHAVMVLLFSQALPISDQWDGEGFMLIRPWLEGKLTLNELFLAHNEHRILTKRVLDMVLLSLNGNHWDNRVLALANAAIYATCIALCFTFATRATAGLTRRALQFAALVIPLLLSNFENTIWGFQSPFYFSVLMTVLALRHIADSPELPYWGLPLATYSLGAIFSLASGLLLGVALGVLVLLDRRPGSTTRRRCLVAAMLFIVAVVGYAILPTLPAENVVMARSLAEILFGALRIASWPLPLLPLAWLPLLAWLGLALKQRRVFDKADLFFLGLAGWVALQALATGYGRGHGLVTVPWRYTDSLVFGLLGNVYFSCQLLAQARERWRPVPRVLTQLGTTGIWLMIGAYLGVASLQGGYAMLQTLRTWQARVLVTDALLRHEPVAEDNPALPYPYLSKIPLFLGNETLLRSLAVENGRLPAFCEHPRTAYLSRLTCLGQTLLPSSPLPQFEPIGETGSGETPSRCSLEYMGGRSPDGSVRRGSPLRFDGWVGPAAPALLPMFGKVNVLLVGDRRSYAAHDTGLIPRKDVTNGTADSRYRWSGFSMYASTAQVEPGSYFVYLRAGGSTGSCRTEIVLDIR